MIENFIPHLLMCQERVGALFVRGQTQGSPLHRAGKYENAELIFRNFLIY
jgi:hypothetical protein